MKLRQLIQKATFFYLKVVTFNKPVCLNMHIDGVIDMNRGGYVGGCTFLHTKKTGL